MKVLKNILIYFIILVLISAVILPKELSNFDELWNYNFAKNISSGLVPYKDFNMVITPFLSFVAAFFMKIFSNELIVMRVLAIILNTTILFLVFKIQENLKINIFINFFSLLGLSYLMNKYFCFDYNYR